MMTTNVAIAATAGNSASDDLAPTRMVHAPLAAKAAEQIIRSFNTWSYKREQPSDANLLQLVTVRAAAQNAPVPFILYWGKGPRRDVAAPDLQCLNYIASLGQRISECYRHGASFTLLLTDTHAHLNDHARSDTEHYFKAIERVSAERGFKCRLLSDVTTAQPDAGKVSDELLSAERASVEMIDTLISSATKWYRGDGSSAQGAMRYFQLNMHEKQAVEREYPDSIFITFNSSRHRLLFPDGLPIFYMYSLKKGVAVKPWFLVDPDASSPDIQTLGPLQ
jgi:L-tyrosine isonitrile synthase